MVAKVTKETKFPGASVLAWCEECQDGVRHSCTVGDRAQIWADRHNAERHNGGAA